MICIDTGFKHVVIKWPQFSIVYDNEHGIQFSV